MLDRATTRTIGAAMCGGALMLLANGIGACSPDMPLPVDPGDGSAMTTGECGDLTFENFGQQFFQNYCLRCHSEDLVGDLARTDAPVGINFNTLEGVREFTNRIRLRAGELGDMPPTILPVPRPSEAERRMLIEWIDCNTPSDTDPVDS